MSDRIYTNDEPVASENLVTVAQACRGVLAKRLFRDGKAISYDQVKYFNFYELNIWSLDELYLWVRRLLNKPRCCLIRARIKDTTKCKKVLRRSNDSVDGPASLISYRCFWFALDIDGYGTCSFDLLTDAHKVLLALPSRFSNVECFAVASASYGFKTGIHMRLFFWSQEPVSNIDILNVLRNNKANADLAIYRNPVQPIYTAAPVFEAGMNDPIDNRILWIQGEYATVNIPSGSINYSGAPEEVYTKQEADAHAAKHLSKISRLDFGERHNSLIYWCIPLGKLVGQNHFEREDIVERIFNHCSFWSPPSTNTKKDMETIIYGVDLGIESMNNMEKSND